jgi:hypothetical protein
MMQGVLNWCSIKPMTIKKQETRQRKGKHGGIHSSA